MGLSQEIPGGLEGQPAHGEVIRKPVETDMFMGKADLGLIRFCEEVDDSLEDPDPFLSEKISERLFVTIYKGDLDNSRLLLQLTYGRLLRVFAGFDVSLGDVPVA